MSISTETSRERLERRWKQHEGLFRAMLTKRLWLCGWQPTMEDIDEALGEFGLRLSEVVEAMHDLPEPAWIREANRQLFNATGAWINRNNTGKSRILSRALHDASQLTDCSTIPDEQALKRERAELVRRALEILEPGERVTVTTCCMHGEPPSTVAKVHGVPTPTLRRNVGNLLTKLAGYLPRVFGSHQPGDFYGNERRPVAVDDPIVGRIRQRFAESVTTESLAHTYGISLKRVWDICYGYRKFKSLGPVVRDKGPGKPKLSAEDIVEARRLRAQGESLVSIAERFDVHASTMSGAINGNRAYAANRG